MSCSVRQGQLRVSGDTYPSQVYRHRGRETGPQGSSWGAHGRGPVSVGGLQSHLRMRSSYQLWVCYFLLTKRPADGLQTEKASVLEEGRLGPPRRPPHRELGPHSPAGHGHVPVVFWRGATWAPEQQRWHLGSWAVGAEQPGERGWVNVQARPGRAPCHGAPGAGGQGAARRRHRGPEQGPDATEAAAGRWGGGPGSLAPSATWSDRFSLLVHQGPVGGRSRRNPFPKVSSVPETPWPGPQTCLFTLTNNAPDSQRSKDRPCKTPDPASGRGRRTDRCPTSATARSRYGTSPPLLRGPRRRAAVTLPHFLRQSHRASASKASSCQVTVVNSRVAAASGSTLLAAECPAAPLGKPCEAGMIVGSFIRDK